MKRFMLVLIVVIGIAVVAKADLLTVDKTTTTDKTDVGGLDSLIKAAQLGNSGDATELDWVKKALGRTDITLDAKYDSNAPNWIWEETGEEGTFSLHFLTKAPDYFVIKTGKLDGTIYDTFLFQNNANLDWAAIRLDVSSGITIKNSGKLSHIDEFNVSSAAVPEPATILLVGCGLIGMVVFTRKAKKS